MIDMHFKPCCHSCNNLNLDYEQTSGFGELVTVIGCCHSHVCGKYQAEQDEKETLPPGCNSKGLLQC